MCISEGRENYPYRLSSRALVTRISWLLYVAMLLLCSRISILYIVINDDVT